MAIGLAERSLSDALVILGAAGLVIPAFARFRGQPGHRLYPGGGAGRPGGAGVARRAIPVASLTSPSPTANRSNPSRSSASSSSSSRSGWSCRSGACGRCAGWCSAPARRSCSVRRR
ncbi:hypothetical protein AB5I41_05480 [Sphingomonas sp. MMS24-JH45]